MSDAAYTTEFDLLLEQGFPDVEPLPAGVSYATGCASSVSTQSSLSCPAGSICTAGCASTA